MQPATVCQRPELTLPRIGAARSRGRGETWEDLGIILETPPVSVMPGAGVNATDGTFTSGVCACAVDAVPTTAASTRVRHVL